MREGSLEKPIRHPLGWREEEFYDEAALDREMRRVFDICHGCRRCFNLCDSFPRLFDLADNSASGELDEVASADFKPVVDACTLCDLCFMTKCPYVPPHEFQLDFPHLMLRYRAVEHRKREEKALVGQLAETDRNGKLASFAAPLANWAAGPGVIQDMAKQAIGVDPNAALPRFCGRTLVTRAMEGGAPPVNSAAPAHGRKAVLYATCFANYNNPTIGLAARHVLARNGVESEVVYPRCCGMPQLEKGDIARVAEHAEEVVATLLPYVEQGYDIVALVPSCALMLKFEWPLILPEHEGVKKLAEASFDISEYVVDIARHEGLAPGLAPLDGAMVVHIACHARAQNMGQKAAELLRLIPDQKLDVVERCSGHGGSWGVLKGNFETAIKVGRPVARAALASEAKYIVSECPLAGAHIAQGVEMLGGPRKPAPHPIELFARAYGYDEAAD
ncbi:MAG TPA: heterodisulfide reductase-related iron-sulfur binding cluster [Dongiaceae bacterium]|jgi:glycerol-3-phosphate dehydrogenase subunit C|nr:heterodisulfide reductase-related iron-sulfur binding cluster [Dongiaceae bacterium]